MTEPSSRSPLFRRLAGPLAGCAISGLIWQLHGGAIAHWVFVGTLLVAGLALTAPRVYEPVQRVLEGAGRLIARGVTWIVLGLLFVSIFVPGRLFLLLRRRDPLQLRRTAQGTYWQLPPTSRETGSFDRQF